MQYLQQDKCEKKELDEEKAETLKWMLEALYHETCSRSDCSTSQNADTDVSEQKLDSKSIDNISGKKAEVKSVEAVEAVKEGKDEEVSDVDQDQNGRSTQQHASFTKLGQNGNGN